MKKQLLIPGVIVLIICTVLCGCNEQTDTNSNDISDVQFVSHQINVKTVNNSTEYIEVTGTIKNVGNKTIDDIKIKVTFYDANNKNLHMETFTVILLKSGKTHNFGVRYYNDEPHYNQYDHYAIKISKGTNNTQPNGTDNSEKNRFVGKWLNATYGVTIDCYPDGSCLFAGDDATWDLKDGKFVIRLVMDVNRTKVMTYTFFNNDNTLALTPEGEPMLVFTRQN
jgi:hypothetical protein